jgi:hypothetical protein
VGGRLPLSEAAGCVWAKSRRSDDGWLPLWRHLDDAAAVAGRLWDEWLPGSVRDRISGCLPRGDAAGRSLLVWLAGVHAPSGPMRSAPTVATSSGVPPRPTGDNSSMRR